MGPGKGEGELHRLGPEPTAGGPLATPAGGFRQSGKLGNYAEIMRMGNRRMQKSCGLFSDSIIFPLWFADAPPILIFGARDRNTPPFSEG